MVQDRVEKMKRITRQELADHLDDILNDIEKNNTAYVVDDPTGRNDILLCPAQWFHYCFDEENDLSDIVENYRSMISYDRPQKEIGFCRM